MKALKSVLTWVVSVLVVALATGIVVSVVVFGGFIISIGIAVITVSFVVAFGSYLVHIYVTEEEPPDSQ